MDMNAFNHWSSKKKEQIEYLAGTLNSVTSVSLKM